jgi:hypothetical protein
MRNSLVTVVTLLGFATFTTAASTQVPSGSSQDENKQERKAEKKNPAPAHKKTGADNQSASASKSGQQVKPDYTRYKKSQTSPVFRADGSSKDPAIAAKPTQKKAVTKSGARPEALTVKQKTGQPTNTAKPEVHGADVSKSAKGQDKKTEKQESQPKL